MVGTMRFSRCLRVTIFVFFHSLRSAQTADVDLDTSFNVEPLQTSGHACLRFTDHNVTGNWSLVPRVGFKQWVYTTGDIVSDSLHRSGSWEQGEVAQLDWALQDVRNSLAQGPASDYEAVLLDIGANVGAFTLHYAHKGHKVLAFEGMEENAQMIQASLCLNPAFADKVTLLNVGLGSRKAVCHVVAHDTNRGDGVTICRDGNQQGLGSPDTLQHRGRMLVDRLDSVLLKLHHLQYTNLHKSKYVIKIDTEGHGFEVMMGALRFLGARRVLYIAAEYFPALLRVSPSGQDGADTYLYLMYGLGYNLSTHGFQGPFEQPQDIVAKVAQMASTVYVNVFMSLRESFRSNQFGL